MDSRGNWVERAFPNCLDPHNNRITAIDYLKILTLETAKGIKPQLAISTSNRLDLFQKQLEGDSAEALKASNLLRRNSNGFKSSDFINDYLNALSQAGTLHTHTANTWILYIQSYFLSNAHVSNHRSILKKTGGRKSNMDESEGNRNLLSYSQWLAIQKAVLSNVDSSIYLSQDKDFISSINASAYIVDLWAEQCLLQFLGLKKFPKPIVQFT